MSSEFEPESGDLDPHPDLMPVGTGMWALTTATFASNAVARGDWHLSPR